MPFKSRLLQPTHVADLVANTGVAAGLFSGALMISGIYDLGIADRTDMHRAYYGADEGRWGDCSTIQRLADYRDWLIEAQRDLEIQDPFQPDVLDGDWKPLVRQARDLDRNSHRYDMRYTASRVALYQAARG